MLLARGLGSVLSVHRQVGSYSDLKFEIESISNASIHCVTYVVCCDL